MSPRYTDLLAQQAQYQDLLREAEQERLARLAQPAAANRQSLIRRLVTWLRAQLPRREQQPQHVAAPRPTPALQRKSS